MDNRTELLGRFAAGPRDFDRCVLADYPPGLLDWLPPVEGAWSVRTHLLHLLDAEVNAFARCRFALAEPGAAVPAWDEEAWASRLAYPRQPLTASLQAFRILRAISHGLLSGLEDAAWDGAWMKHSQKGEVRLADWLAGMVAHTDEHRAYIERNERLFREAGIGAIHPHA